MVRIHLQLARRGHWLPKRQQKSADGQEYLQENVTRQNYHKSANIYRHLRVGWVPRL
jgi:hypothetical protein